MYIFEGVLFFKATIRQTKTECTSSRESSSSKPQSDKPRQNAHLRGSPLLQNHDQTNQDRMHIFEGVLFFKATIRQTKTECTSSRESSSSQPRSDKPRQNAHLRGNPLLHSHEHYKNKQITLPPVFFFFFFKYCLWL